MHLDAQVGGDKDVTRRPKAIEGEELTGTAQEKKDCGGILILEVIPSI